MNKNVLCIGIIIALIFFTSCGINFHPEKAKTLTVLLNDMYNGIVVNNGAHSYGGYHYNFDIKNKEKLTENEYLLTAITILNDLYEHKDKLDSYYYSSIEIRFTYKQGTSDGRIKPKFISLHIFNSEEHKLNYAKNTGCIETNIKSDDYGNLNEYENFAFIFNSDFTDEEKEAIVNQYPDVTILFNEIVT